MLSNVIACCSNSSNTAAWASNSLSNYALSNGQSNWNFASNTALWTSNALSNLIACCSNSSNTAAWASNNFSNISSSKCCEWLSNTLSNYALSNGQSNWNFSSNTASWTSNMLSNLVACCSSGGGTSNNTCTQHYSDIVTIPSSGPVTINHNLDLADPNAFTITVYDQDTGTWLTPKITSTTSNSLELTGTALTMNARINIQRNEPCGSGGSNKVCAYEYISAINSTQTLSDGTIATVSGSTGGTTKTFQGITGYNVGDLEDNEKITVDFSKTVTRIRLTLEAAERISGVYEQVKLFLNGAPYAVQASQMTTPVTAGGRFALIDGGFTLDPVSVADDASALIVIEPPSGITSFSVQDIRVSGAPNGVVARIEALVCK
jgi:hypothetical protein